MQNKAAVMHGTHDVRLEDVPVPEPGPKEVLVEIRAVGVCGSDIHYYQEGRIGSFVVREPLILGHESMGTVVALGEEATKHEVGERVMSRTEAGSVTSGWKKVPSSFSATSGPVWSLTSAITISAPARRKAREIASPRLWPPPVTTATLSRKENSSISSASQNSV